MSKKNKELVCASAHQRRMPFEFSAAEPTVTRDGAKEAFRTLRASARRNGVQDLTINEINEEIRQARCGEKPRYLQQYHDGIYTGQLLSGKLNAHLEEIDRSANEMFDLLMKQHAAREGATEQFKVESQIEWVRRMNNIREWVETVVNHDLFCM